MSTNNNLIPTYDDVRNLSQSAFNELIAVEPTPEVQTNAIYNLGGKMRSVNTGSATADVDQSLYICSTGTTPGSIASIFTERALVYRAGQGAMSYFTALFESPGSVGTSGRAGLLNATDEFSLGYNDGRFGLLHKHDGSQEIQELQITNQGNGAETATVTINGTPYAVPLAQTTVEGNASEIAAALQGTVPLYNFQQIEDIVSIRSILATAQPGAFSFSSTGTAIGSYTQITAGIAAVEDWIYREPIGNEERWNGADVSWFKPEFGNVFRIDYEWLGFGGASWSIQNPITKQFDLIHRLRYPNSNVIPVVSNPTFRVGYTGTNGPTTDDIVVKGGSVALFNQGKRFFTQETRSVNALNETFTTGALRNVLTIKVRVSLGRKLIYLILYLF